MEPRIQYAKTSDGVNIAFWTLGEGAPLVQMMSPPFSHVELVWHRPELSEFYRRLGANRRLIGLDCRGTGLSDHWSAGFPLETLVLDLEAVVDRLGLTTFALGAMVNSGPVAIAYAARHPERVSHLLLWCAWARGAEAFPPPARAMLDLITSDWELYTETTAHMMVGWAEGEQAHKFASFMRECVRSDVAEAFTKSSLSWDVTPLLPKVRAPTLVANRRNVRWPLLDQARHIASQIPDAHFVVLEGDSIAPYLGDTESVLNAIHEFLGEGGLEPSPPSATADDPSPVRGERGGPGVASGTAIILFADIADSTGETERLGDAAFRAKARDLDGALRAAIRERGGTPVEGKLLGDGVLAVFTSAREAIEAALACGEQGRHAGLPLHLGIHAGDVIREEGNVYGGAVNIASRIAGLSAAGEVLVSDTVRGLARTSAGVRFEDRGEQALKGVGEAVRVWKIVSE